MMANLFSIFDPVTPSILKLNWISMIVFMLLYPGMVWKGASPFSNYASMLKDCIFSEFKPILKKSAYNLMIFISIFMFIIMNNLMGLLPYVFTATAHMSVSLSMALPLWAGLVIYGWANNHSNILVHLIPQGTPTMLMPFMVVIEMISNLIRPATLAIRLAANMIAGHLLISLISDAFKMCPFILLPIYFSAQVALNLLEIAVAFIQGYVFSVLSTLYLAEASN